MCQSARPVASLNGAARLPAGLWREGEAAEQCGRRRAASRTRTVPSSRGLLPALVFLKALRKLACPLVWFLTACVVSRAWS